MKLSPAAELAVRGALVLADRYGKGLTPLEAVCLERQLPRDYLAKIFASLARARLVRPVRGKRGGYELARDPARISLLEVIEAVEGPLALNLCQQDPPACDRIDCGVRSVWSELQDLIRRKLGSTSLTDCLRRGRNPASAGELSPALPKLA